MNILFLTQADGKSGLGHLGRCAALSKAFIKSGHSARIFSIQPPNYNVPHDLTLSSIITSHNLSPDRLEHELKEFPAEITVVDMHNPPDFIFKKIKNHLSMSVALSIIGKHNYMADIIVNPLAKKYDSSFSGKVINNKNSYIYDPSRFTPPTNPPLQIKNYALLNLGGSTCLEHQYRSLINQIIEVDNLSAVIFIQNSKSLKTLQSEYANNTNLHFINSNITAYMPYATYMICGFGTTLWESLSLGIPCFVVPLSPLHLKFAKQLQQDFYEIAPLYPSQGYTSLKPWIEKLQPKGSTQYKQLQQKIFCQFHSDTLPKLVESLTNQISTFNND